MNELTRKDSAPMIGGNLRHLRVFLAVGDCGSVTLAADRCFVSQPAVTQAIAKLEQIAGRPLFRRTPQGFFLTGEGQMLESRVRRAIDMLDAALGEIAPRLILTATRAQLSSLIATSEAQNFSLAARRLGVSQPTVHRAITQLEHEADRPLFQRSHFGVIPTRSCKALATAARLAFVELDQAAAELAELSGQEGGSVVIGAMPLSRASVLPRALSRFRQERPKSGVQVLDGAYDELLAGLRRGEIDFLIGALRDPLPIVDVVQERLFDDTLVFLCGQHHPLMQQGAVTVADLQDYPWLVFRQGTPSRRYFDQFFAAQGQPAPEQLIETGSVILMREMLDDGRHLACMSRLQVAREIDRGLVATLPIEVTGSTRAIGLTYRQGWVPTPAQKRLLDMIRADSAV